MCFFKYIKPFFLIQNIMLHDINQRISSEFCLETAQKLSDTSLLEVYRNSKSVKKNVNTLSNILEKHVEISTETREAILEEYLLKMISPGLKGQKRGEYFNKIVREKIESFQLSPDIYEVAFEKNCNLAPTKEKPDWYIIDKIQNKTLIGMNQVDLWGGGQQTNRAAKYILEDPFEHLPNVKLMGVVCYFIELKSNKNKSFKILEKGFEKNTI